MSTARSRRISDADLYFKSAEKSQGEIQFYWVALAAFVVKDIVHAYEYTRDRVLSGAWRGSAGDTFGQDPYTHAMRTYLALAKGNLWLFLDKSEVQLLINPSCGRDAVASERLDRQVKVAWNDLYTSHPRRTVPDCHPFQSRT